MKKFLTQLSAATLIFTAAYSQSYQKNFQKEMKNIFGKEMKKNKFVFRQVPFDNFGLITAFKDEVKYGEFVCAMFNCIGHENNPKITSREDFEKWLHMDGFAEVGEAHSTVHLTKNAQNDFSLNMALPKLFSFLGIDAGFASNRIKDVTLNLGNFYLRLLRPGRYLSYMQSDAAKKYNPYANDLFRKGELVVVRGDIVVEYIEMTITVDDSLAANLNAKIGGDSTTAPINIQGAALNFSARKNKDGSYYFKVNSPVIIAFLPKKQEEAGTLAAPKEEKMTMQEIADYWGKYRTYPRELKTNENGQRTADR